MADLKSTAPIRSFSLSQDFVVASGIAMELTDQEKANWIEAYVDLIDPQIFVGLSSNRGSKPHPPVQMFKLAVYETLKRHLSPGQVGSRSP
jgi:hypothetical protein